MAIYPPSPTQTEPAERRTGEIARVDVRLISAGERAYPVAFAAEDGRAPAAGEPTDAGKWAEDAPTAGRPAAGVG